MGDKYRQLCGTLVGGEKSKLAGGRWPRPDCFIEDTNAAPPPSLGATFRGPFCELVMSATNTFETSRDSSLRFFFRPETFLFVRKADIIVRDVVGIEVLHFVFGSDAQSSSFRPTLPALLPNETRSRHRATRCILPTSLKAITTTRTRKKLGPRGLRPLPTTNLRPLCTPPSDADIAVCALRDTTTTLPLC